MECRNQSWGSISQPRKDHRLQTLVVSFGGVFWMDLSPLFLAGSLLCVFFVVCFSLSLLG